MSSEDEEDDVVTVLGCEIPFQQLVPQHKLHNCVSRKNGTFLAFLGASDSRPDALQVLCKPVSHIAKSEQGDWPELLALQNMHESDKIIGFLGVCIDFREPSNPQPSEEPYLILEYHPDSLLDHAQGDIIDMNNVSELAKEMTQCVAHVHESGFIHRDITLESFYLHHRIVVRNLTYAKSLQALKSPGKRHRSEMSDTHWRHSAPETLFDQTYSRKSDIWMFGIALWQLFDPSPQTPFKSFANRLQLIAFFTDVKANPEVYLFQAEIWQEECLSGFRNVISSCCTISAHERPTIQSVCEELCTFDFRPPMRRRVSRVTSVGSSESLLPKSPSRSSIDSDEQGETGKPRRVFREDSQDDINLSAQRYRRGAVVVNKYRPQLLSKGPRQGEPSVSGDSGSNIPLSPISLSVSTRFPSFSDIKEVDFSDEQRSKIIPDPSPTSGSSGYVQVLSDDRETQTPTNSRVICTPTVSVPLSRRTRRTRSSRSTRSTSPRSPTSSSNEDVNQPPRRRKYSFDVNMNREIGRKALEIQASMSKDEIKTEKKQNYCVSKCCCVM